MVSPSFTYVYLLPTLFLGSRDTSSNTSEFTPEERREQQKEAEALHAGSLQVPRRPPWNAGMSVEELDGNERQAFLIWRRSLSRLDSVHLDICFIYHVNKQMVIP